MNQRSRKRCSDYEKETNKGALTMPSKYGQKVDRFYRSAGWRKARAAAIAEARGVCQKCHRRKGTEVHHIIPVTDSNVDNPAIALGRDNLMVLCKECHDSIRSEDDGGTSQSFDESTGDIELHDRSKPSQFDVFLSKK